MAEGGASAQAKKKGPASAQDKKRATNAFASKKAPGRGWVEMAHEITVGLPYELEIMNHVKFPDPEAFVPRADARAFIA